MFDNHLSVLPFSTNIKRMKLESDWFILSCNCCVTFFILWIEFWVIWWRHKSVRCCEIWIALIWNRKCRSDRKTYLNVTKSTSTLRNLPQRYEIYLQGYEIYLNVTKSTSRLRNLPSRLRNLPQGYKIYLKVTKSTSRLRNLP